MVAHSEVLLSKCAQFRDEGQFIDIRLKVGEDIFPAHRIVLAANSDYFHAMFNDGMKESNQEVIELKDESISPDALKIVMDSIYSGDLRVDKENVFEVLAAADHLQVTTVVQQCCDFLKREFIQLRLDLQNYTLLSTVADRHGLKDLQEAAEKKLASMFKDVCESEEFLTHIAAEHLQILLSRDDIVAPSETFVLKSVIQWIKHKKEERMAVAAKVIGAVRLGLVDIRVVIEELNTAEMQEDPDIHMLVYEALIFSHVPSHNFAEEKTKPRSVKPVLVAILPQTLMQYFDDETKTWKPLPSMAQLTEATECSCGEYVGNYLYVATKKANEFFNYRYDTVSNSWETLPPVLSHVFSKSHIDSFCSVDEYLYVITSGSICAPFRYSPAKKNWQGGASLGFVKKQFDEPNNRLTNATAVVWNSHIYVLHGLKKAEKRSRQEQGNSQSNSTNTGLFGGQVLVSGGMFGVTSSTGSSLFGTGRQLGQTSFQNAAVSTSPSQVWVGEPAVLHRFDPKLNEWKQLSSTCHPHCNSGLFVVDNRLYVAESCTRSSQSGLVPPGPAPVEVYDEKNDTWSVVEQKHIPLNNLGAVEIEGRVYFIINKFPVDSGIRIPPEEIYHVHLDEWENVATVSNKAILCYLPVKRESLKTEYHESQAD